MIRKSVCVVIHMGIFTCRCFVRLKNIPILVAQFVEYGVSVEHGTQYDTMCSVHVVEWQGAVVNYCNPTEFSYFYDENTTNQHLNVRSTCAAHYSDWSQFLTIKFS